jgi:hypothetical protein|tara:strand:+ start:1733 stop:2617 length:885 start_codon:yes stop_codon:yes gene_type:complete
MSQIKLPYGIKAGKLTHVAYVKQGSGCECICPKCAGALVAAKGEVYAEHFRHHDLSDCEGAAEFALRAKIIELLQSNLQITLPASLDPTNSLSETLVDETTVEIDSMTEVSSSAPLTPRFEIKTSGHEAEETITVVVNLGKKAPKDTDDDRPYIEINLADLDELTEERVREAVQGRTGCWRWIKRPLAEKKLQEKLHYSRIHTTPEDAKRILSRAHSGTESTYFKSTFDGAVAQPPKPSDPVYSKRVQVEYSCQTCGREKIPEGDMQRFNKETRSGFCSECVRSGKSKPIPWTL